MLSGSRSCGSKSTLGAPARNLLPLSIATAIIFPSGALKQSSRPSALHRGQVPPPVEIDQGRCLDTLLSVEKGFTYTSQRPDSSDQYASHRPSGEIRPSPSLNWVRAIASGVLPFAIGSTHRSHFVSVSNCAYKR